MKPSLAYVLATVILALNLAGHVAAETAPVKPPFLLTEDAQKRVDDILSAGKALKDGDYPTALRIYRRGANQGDAGSQVSLGVMYEKGQGTKQNYVEAAKWYRKAADQGDEIAQYNLAVMHAEGRGVVKSYGEALKLYRLAAGRGYDRAQSNLGVMYAEGRGVGKDNVLAHMWFSLSAAKGYQQGITNRNLVAESMTPAQLLQAETLAREWKPTKAQPR